jgi:hypothetical protein
MASDWQGSCLGGGSGIAALMKKISSEHLKRFIKEELFYREFYRKVVEQENQKREKNENHQTKTKRNH